MPGPRVTADGFRLALFTDTYPPQVNGVARTLERLVGALADRGGEARVYTVEDPEATPDPRVERWPAVPFWAYPQLRMAAPGFVRARRALEAWRPTLVHAATPFGVGLGARSAAIAAGVPLVTSYHTHFTAYLRHYGLSALDAVSWPFLRWFHNSGRRTYAPSETVRRELEGHGFTHTRVWSRGVDRQRFHPRFRSRARRTALGATDDTVLVAYVGRIAPEKGIEVALEGMRLAMAEVPGRLRFVLTGDGPAEEKARTAAPADTVFTGKLTGTPLAELYASADVFVFPSTTETFGNVVLEAMASGLAVVAPDAGPTLELAHDRTALTFDARDPKALAACVSRLAIDAALRRRLADAALAEADARSWDAIFDGLVTDYLDVAGQAGVRKTA